MNYNEILLRLAPCGLHCGKCFAFSEGEIADFSRRLRMSLGEFDVYAQRFVELLDEPVFKKYPDFKEIFALLSEGQCKIVEKKNVNYLKIAKSGIVLKAKESTSVFNVLNFYVAIPDSIKIWKIGQ